MSESEDHRARSFSERARSVLSNVGQDDRVKQAAALSKDVAARAGEASKSVTHKLTQEDAWNELRSDLEYLTEIARAHQALIVDLIDRVTELEAQTGAKPGTGRES